jgi:hypothetical protein
MTPSPPNQQEFSIMTAQIYGESQPRIKVTGQLSPRGFTIKDVVFHEMLKELSTPISYYKYHIYIIIIHGIFELTKDLEKSVRLV